MSDTSPAKRSRRKEARPGEIIAAGIKEFSAHGFERARLDRIATAAGVAKGTIYLYFENKEALFEAAVEEYVVSMMAATEQDFSVSPEASTIEMIKMLMARAYGHFASDGPLAIMRILIAEGQRFPHLTETYHRIAISRGVKILQGLLDRGIARGEIRESAMTQTPEIIIAPCMFYAINKMAFDGFLDIDQDAFMAAHQQMVLAGLGLEG